MEKNIGESLPKLYHALGLGEQPLGTCFTNKKPENGYSPKPLELPTIEKEQKNQVNWQSVFSGFSCVMGKIRFARKKKTSAYFSKERFGCVGGAYWFGYVSPLPDTIIHYISNGIPNIMDGERYYDSPDKAKKMLAYMKPEPASDTYCVFKPLDDFGEDENPDFISFFVRPEALSGLHRLATFVTNDPETVVSPSSAACGSLVAWPRYYLSKGLKKVVIGGMDPSARQFFKIDEVSVTMSLGLLSDMINCFEDSFMTTKTWANVQKKISLSNKKWR